MNNNTAQIIAHRGASFDAPENTLESFRLGWEQGADAIECDVHLSLDGHLVVIHDPHTRRISRANREVGQTNLAELKTLDAGSWKSPKWQAARISALAEVLDLLPEDCRIFIEIKTGLAALVPLEKLLSASDVARSQIVLMEFDLETVIALKKSFPEVEVLWLNKFPKWNFPGQTAPALMKNARTALQYGLDGLNVQDVSQLSGRFLQSSRALGLSCYCWTVDDPARAAELIENGIAGIATNRPGWMREQLERI